MSSAKNINITLKIWRQKNAKAKGNIETYQLNRHMDSLMEGTRVRGRREANELSGF